MIIMETSDILEVYDCDGLRVVDQIDSWVDDYDNVEHDDYEYGESRLVINSGTGSHYYPLSYSVVPYRLYREIEDGVTVGYVQRDLEGNIL
jgi:hypothetical protein